MRGKLLFIDKSFDIGGIQTSMINMVNSLIDMYEIDLFIYNPNGALKERVDSRVNIIGADTLLESCGMSFSHCLKKGTVLQKLFRVFSTVWCKLFDNRLPLNIAFRHQKKIGHYDVAIAYHHEADKKALTSGFARFAKKCVDADRCFSWIHNDAVANPIDEAFNDGYYKQLDKIVCVSESVRNSFVSKHPDIPKDKIKVCYNFLDFKKIAELLCEEMPIAFDDQSLNCFSACRLKYEKAIPRALDTLCDIIKTYNVKWYIAGEGADKVLIEDTIFKNKLSDNVFLLGQQKNPYIFMKYADLIMLTSYFEAAPMLYSEARYLKKPVFSTRISSSEEMLDGGKYGIICENSPQGMKEAFLEVCQNKAVLDRINKNLQEDNFSIDNLLDSFNTIVSDD